LYVQTINLNVFTAKIKLFIQNICFATKPFTWEI